MNRSPLDSQPGADTRQMTVHSAWQYQLAPCKLGKTLFSPFTQSRPYISAIIFLCLERHCFIASLRGIVLVLFSVFAESPITAFPSSACVTVLLILISLYNQRCQLPDSICRPLRVNPTACIVTDQLESSQGSSCFASSIALSIITLSYSVLFPI